MLKARGRGRPGRGAEPSQVVALRITLEEITAIDERAEREGKSRSEVIREALYLGSINVNDSALKHRIFRNDAIQAAMWAVWIRGS